MDSLSLKEEISPISFDAADWTVSGVFFEAITCCDKNISIEVKFLEKIFFFFFIFFKYAIYNFLKKIYSCRQIISIWHTLKISRYIYIHINIIISNVIL